MPGHLLNTQAGFWGKLPVRGDFVGRGLPGGFRRRWDAWASAHLARRTDWPQGGLRLRIEGGKRAAAGLVLPSADRIGRPFPLALFLLADALPGVPALEPWCEAALAATAEAEPEALGRALERLPLPDGAPEDGPPLLLWRRGLAPVPADPWGPEQALAAVFSSD
ncbi:MULTISPECIES: type VI secretion system-associated protein TagF [unclassified Paracoccus (in: a-proteobacteria)]|uniref:type VI secretion system-associated protein TagF n=1 Tax=unclassified Paracoccus (in: a-proteobacteria) TaxID=2688777 RepID=UPI0016019AF1|nr:MULTISPECIES: type VI secretion system-associated protein TagF [unclassified Paracoccus (in: a-proteobacteria)]MBB1490584.1 type VI secretion system-associated protein TagF [Paracoccus sp. MC1854]MBB1499076.1 type VI secretion system-associated protein TagF [Paracoccus sp. MC1862]QQO46077.1 type VI secretion system-associated protein TagF [Paracoccus sp. MC1862]